MFTAKRYFLFLCGLFFVAFGISCTVISMLGTPPISSAPYVLSLRFPVSLGGFIFMLNMVYLFGQIMILGRRFQFFQLLQIPATGVFGLFIDFTMYLLGVVTPETYSSKLFFILVGSTSMGLGVALEIIGNVVTLPADGIVNVISSQWNFDFGITKTSFDASIVIIGGLLSWFYFGEVYGIREGTLICALVTGAIARFFIKRLTIILPK